MAKTLIGNKNRLTLGLMADWAEADYQMKIIFGAIDAAKEHGVNLVCIEGGNIHSNRDMDKDRNFLYDFAVKSDILDGVIVLTGGVGYYASHEQITEFCHQIHPLPVVSIVEEIEGCSSIVLDNVTGLRNLLVHLIEVHQCRKFAVINCPEEHRDAIIRFNTIKETLQKHHIELKEEMIVSADFAWTEKSAKEALEVLIDQRKLQFDAIIATSDNIAWGVLEALRQRGYRVPEEVAVIGFDNFDYSAYSNPPLSTVNQPLYEQGVKAVELLIGMIRNGEKPKTYVVQTDMVIRESCGCIPYKNHESLTHVELTGKEAFGGYALNRQSLVAEIIQSIKLVPGELKGFNLEDWIGKVIDAVEEENAAGRSEILNSCYEMLYRAIQIEERMDRWQSILSKLRAGILPKISNKKRLIEVEDLFHQARVMIGEKVVEREKIVYQDTLKNNVVLNKISEELLSTFNMKQLVEVLTVRLPELGITSGFVSRFLEGRHKQNMESELILAFNKAGRKKINSKAAHLDGLVPSSIFDDNQPHAILISLLNFSKMRFGIMGVELDLRNTTIYGALRRIICSSLNGVLLNGRIMEQEKRLIAREYAKNIVQFKKAMEGFIDTIQLTMEMRDPYTTGHQYRVADLAQAIAVEMKLPSDTVEGIRMAGIVHDIGKIAVPTEILNKPGKLRKTEMELIKEHPQVAYDILKNLKFPWPIAEIILQHHERLNGTGYPNGLKDGEIRLEARILAVADVIEAMASHRPYRPALGIEKALEEIQVQQGEYYDSSVTEACVRLIRDKGYKLI